MEKDPEKIMPHVLIKWRWFTHALVHLRGVDAAEQLEENRAVGGLRANESPTSIRRRASLFGSVVGIYQEHSHEGVFTVTRCIGDTVMTDMTVGQVLRLRKSTLAHRHGGSKLFFDDVRPGEPRRLESTGNKIELPGLLAALEIAKKELKSDATAFAESQRFEDGHCAGSLRNRVCESTEYHNPRNKHIFDILRASYDPEDQAHVTNDFYSPVNLLRRESWRFDPQIKQLLRTIWKATDMDESGAIDRLEYMELHNCLTCALVGRGAGDSMMRIFLSQDDWNAGVQNYASFF